MHKHDDIPVYFGMALERPFASVLNSRQTKMPKGDEQWIRRTIDAVRHLIDRNVTILTSLGMHTWNILAWSANFYGGKQIIILPLFPDDDPEDIVQDVLEDFALDASRVGFAFYRTDSTPTRPKGALIERDRQIIRLSDEIVPISIRPNGNLEREIANSAQSWAKVSDAFRVDYTKPKRYNPLSGCDIEAVRAKFSGRWELLTHWTHSFPEPWPRETSADFYKAIALSGTEYPRSAMKTLERILSSGKIFGTKARFRNDFPNVSFTSLDPANAVKLMKWDSRSGRWSMEPYGIAIDIETARDIGVRKVIYGDETLFERLSDDDRLFFQPHGKKGDWSRELEWRHIGDFQISEIPREKILAIVPTECQAESIREKFGLDAVSLI
ncbi:MAG TPA: hypothetical protein ENN07_00670 [candidate division Zixibacteria bacterium]|nr:hypothetical protein [candidate division Zixibacteria bacterium]